MDFERLRDFGKWQRERDQQLRDLEFQDLDRKAHLVQSHIHPSLWLVVKDPLAQLSQRTTIDHSLRSDEGTANLHDHERDTWESTWMTTSLLGEPRCTKFCKPILRRKSPPKK